MINQINDIDKQGSKLDQLVSALVDKYCKDLDKYMEFIKSVLEDDKAPPSDDELDDFTLNIPTLMYFASEAQESLGLREDIAKAVFKQKFDTAFSSMTGTVADKTAGAQLEAQKEALIHAVHTRAYKKIKARMEIALELLQSVKKVSSRRMLETELSKADRRG